MKDGNKIRKILIFFFVLCTIHYSLFTSCSAEVLNRVVAYVDDAAITLAEFRETFAKMKEASGNISGEEVVSSMINRQLLLKEARKMRLDAASKDDLLRDYIDIKIKTSVLIKEKDAEKFFNEHRKEFNGKDYQSVRDEIEKYLFETEVSRQLKKHLDELRSRAVIRIQLIEDSKQ